MHTQSKGDLAKPTQWRQYPYQLAYHRVKTVPCTTTRDNNRSTKVHKNSNIRLASYITPARVHQNPTTEITVSFYSHRNITKREFPTRWKIVHTLVNRLTPNDPYMGRTAPLTSKRCILYIYSTNIGTEYFKHAL